MKKLLSLFLALVMMATMIPAAAAAGFADVDGGAWYADAVDYVVSNKLMSGYSADKFGPNDTLNRAMVVQILYNKEGQPAPSGKHEFNDVASGDWFNNAVTWGTKRGVMSGYGGGRFAPNDNVTLEQIAVILWNYSGNPAFTAKADSVGSHSSWAANGLGWAVENGILANVPYGAVTEGATRAQTAQMLTNFLSGKGQEDADTNGATGITLDITSHKMGEDWTQYLTATLSPAGAKDTITWSSSNPKVATVDQKGKVSGVAGGEAIITAKIPSGATATCKIEVWHSHKLTDTEPVGTDGVTEVYTCACGHSYESWVPAVKVTAVDLGTGSASVDVGKTITLNATVSPSNATFKDVTWSSSNTSVATVSGGKVTGVAPGTAKIYAAAGGVKAYCTVTVNPAPIVFSGTGSKVVSGVNIPAGSYFVEYTYSGTSNFISKLWYGSDSYDYHSLTNDIGPCSGRNELIDKIGPIRNGELEVSHAKGPWTIVFRPVSGTTTTNIKGTGFVVTGVFTATQSRYTVTMSHRGDSNFISRVVEYNADDSYCWESLVNEIGDYDGQRVISLETGKQYYVYVNTGRDETATWSIDFGVGDKLTTYKAATPSSVTSGTGSGGTVSGGSSSSGSSSSGSSSSGSSSSGSSSGSSSVQRGMQTLASALRSNGTRSSSGDYVIGGYVAEGSNAFISYSPSDNTVQFLFGYEDTTSECLAAFSYDLSAGKTKDALFDYESITNTDFSGFATLNISTYTSDTVLRFTSISGTSLGSSANNLANAGFKLGMACWDLLLATNLNMDMSDIGFSNY